MGSLQGINYLVPIIVIPILLERIGIENYGAISVAQAVVNILVVIGDFGLNLTGTKLFSQNSILKRHSRLLGNILLGKLFLWLILGSLLLILTFVIPTWKDIQIILLFSLSISLGQSLMPTAYFQGVQKMGTLAIMMILSRLCYLAGILFFIKSPSDYVWVNLINGISLTFFATLGLIISIKKVRHISISITETFNLMKSNTTVFFSISAGTFYRNIPLIIAGFTLNELNLGIYSIIDKVIQLIANSYSVIFRAIFPIVCQKIESARAEIRNFFISAFSPLIIVSVLSGLIIYIWGSDLIHLLDNTLETSTLQPLMVWLSIIPTAVLLNVIVSLLILGFNLNKVYLNYHLIAVLTVLILSPLSFMYGIKPLIISFVMAELLMLVFGTIQLLKRPSTVMN